MTLGISGKEVGWVGSSFGWHGYPLELPSGFVLGKSLGSDLPALVIPCPSLLHPLLLRLNQSCYISPAPKLIICEYARLDCFAWAFWCYHQILEVPLFLYTNPFTLLPSDPILVGWMESSMADIVI